MRGLSEFLHTLALSGCLLLVLATIMLSAPAEANQRQSMRDRLFSSHRPRRDLDLEGLPPEIRERIAASRMRPSIEEPQAAPNCWVEVDVPRRVGGVCRRIENMPACSVNDNLYINHPDCM